MVEHCQAISRRLCKFPVDFQDSPPGVLDTLVRHTVSFFTFRCLTMPFEARLHHKPRRVGLGYLVSSHQKIYFWYLPISGDALRLGR